MNYTYGESSLRNSYHTVRVLYLSLILNVAVSQWITDLWRLRMHYVTKHLGRGVRITNSAVTRALCVVGFNFIWVVINI
jgi:hypothetical protein